jgi:hypothetical protein
MGTPTQAPIANALKGRLTQLRPLSSAKDAPQLFRLSAENVVEMGAEMKAVPSPAKTRFVGTLMTLRSTPREHRSQSPVRTIGRLGGFA